MWRVDDVIKGSQACVARLVGVPQAKGAEPLQPPLQGCPTWLKEPLLVNARAMHAAMVGQNDGESEFAAGARACFTRILVQLKIACSAISFVRNSYVLYLFLITMEEGMYMTLFYASIACS